MLGGIDEEPWVVLHTQIPISVIIQCRYTIPSAPDTAQVMTPTTRHFDWHSICTNPCKHRKYTCTLVQRLVYSCSSPQSSFHLASTTAACPHATRYQSLSLLCSGWLIICLSTPALLVVVRPDVTSQPDSYDSLLRARWRKVLLRCVYRTIRVYTAYVCMIGL